MANVKFSALSTTTDANGFVPIVLTPGIAASKVNLRDVIIGLAAGGMTYLGLFDASTEVNLPAGNNGDLYIVSNTGANPSIVNGISLLTGDTIICNTDATPLGTPANWDVVSAGTTPDATELIKGITAYATIAETEARLLSTKAVVPSALANFVLESELINQKDQLVTYQVQMIFDDLLNDLPATDTILIDGQTVVTGNLVYVKDSSDAGKIDSVYIATVDVGGNITWLYQYTVGKNAVYSKTGIVYGDIVLMDESVSYFFEDLYTTLLEVDDITINNSITADNYNLNYDVKLTFNDPLNSLPAIDTTLIDGQIVVSGDLVYVKDSATIGEVGNVYSAVVDGSGNITWTLFATPKSGDIIHTMNGTVYGDTIVDASNNTVTNITNLKTENIITNNYNLNYNIDYVFDDSGNSLPATNAILIDGQILPLSSTKLVYVKDSATLTEIGKVFEAVIDGLGNITYTELYVLKDGDTFYTQLGAIYGDTVNNYSNSTISNIGSKTYKSVVWSTTGTTNTIINANITTDTIILGWTITSGTQNGFWEWNVLNGSVVITSSVSETAGLTFNYITN